jgi:hypothetical protein
MRHGTPRDISADNRHVILLAKRWNSTELAFGSMREATA